MHPHDAKLSSSPESESAAPPLVSAQTRSILSAPHDAIMSPRGDHDTHHTVPSCSAHDPSSASSAVPRDASGVGIAEEAAIVFELGVIRRLERVHWSSVVWAVQRKTAVG